MSLLRVDRITCLTSAELTSIEDIYISSFPASQRVPLADLAIEGNRYWWIAHAEGEYLGFGVAGDLPASQAILLEYLAVKADRRSQGVGTAILRTIADDMASHLYAARIVFELEPIENHDVDTERRLNFYTRWGAEVIKCAPRYRMPDLTSAGTLPMLLMCYPLADKSCTKLNSDELRRLIIEIWTRSYQRELDDPDLAQILVDLVC